MRCLLLCPSTRVLCGSCDTTWMRQLDAPAGCASCEACRHMPLPPRGPAPTSIGTGHALHAWRHRSCCPDRAILQGLHLLHSFTAVCDLANMAKCGQAPSIHSVARCGSAEASAQGVHHSPLPAARGGSRLRGMAVRRGGVGDSRGPSRRGGRGRGGRCTGTCSARPPTPGCWRCTLAPAPNSSAWCGPFPPSPCRCLAGGTRTPLLSGLPAAVLETDADAQDCSSCHSMTARAGLRVVQRQSSVSSGAERGE